MKTTVIYHSADYDGIFCREIARHFLGDKDKDVETHPTAIPGYRIDGVAACRLVWQWFSWVEEDRQPENMPDKQRFIDRKVEEPLSVRLAGEYDIWDKRDPRGEEFQFGLRGQDMNDSDWRTLLSTNGDGTRAAEILCDQGKRLQSYQQKIDANLVTHRSYRIKWEGLDFLVLNTGRFNSLTFAALDKPETGHDALLGYMFNGKAWTVSLYHANHRKDLDLSAIAVKHGGGGHRGACGFTCKNLPFN